MKDKIKITIDTREQTPWSFPAEFAEVSIGTLHEGDYAIDGDERFSIERKSLDDFLGTISSGWDRFEREMDRMSEKGFANKVIIVEGDFESVCFRDIGVGIEEPNHNHPMIEPQFVLKRISQLALDHGACILFAGNAQYASGMAYAILRHRNSQLNLEKLNAAKVN